MFELVHANANFSGQFFLCTASYYWRCNSAGTDTIGCIRIPAAFCGIFVYRPSHGALSSTGVLANSQSLDTTGMHV